MCIRDSLHTGPSRPAWGHYPQTTRPHKRRAREKASPLQWSNTLDALNGKWRRYVSESFKRDHQHQARWKGLLILLGPFPLRASSPKARYIDNY
eukprot:2144129-Pyramimonas_sp.AAC.2